MARRLFVGALAAGSVMWMAGAAAAGQAAPATTRVDGGVRFTIGTLPGESTLRAEGNGVTFSKRLTAERVQIRIEVPGDWFALEATPDGAARLRRQGKSLDLRMTADGKEIEKAQRFAAGSKALAGFESLAGALESSVSPEAQSVRTSFALLHAVRGSVMPARELARSVQARHAAGAKRASWAGRDEMPYECWMNYAITVAQYMAEYNSCYLDYGWIPGMQAVCTFEWMLKAELAWFWVIGCSGGVPV